jgi:hypothetical protein
MIILPSNGFGVVVMLCLMALAAIVPFVVVLWLKIGKPKQYRAFANKAEYAPHRDRWIKSTTAERDGVYFTFRVANYDDWGVVFGGSKETYQAVFNRYVFDNLDGTTEPFGVEVQ